MTTRSTRSTFPSEPVEVRDKNRTTRPSREVQRLLRTAGPDRPDISDLEDLGNRRTRRARVTGSHSLEGSSETRDQRQEISKRKHRLQSISQPAPTFSQDSYLQPDTQNRQQLTDAHIRIKQENQKKPFNAGSLILDVLREAEAKLRCPTQNQRKVKASQESLISLEPAERTVQIISSPQSKSPKRAKAVVRIEDSLLPILVASLSMRTTNREKLGDPRKHSSRKTSGEDETWKIRCICGAREEGNDDTEAWIGCDECGNWQHNVCMGISIYIKELPKKYKCQDCAPKEHKELLDGMDQGERPWEKRRKDYENKLAEKEKTSKKRKRKDEESHPILQNEKTLDAGSLTSHESRLFPLTDQCHHYVHRSDVDWDIQKYFGQRYSIFSRYDEGIYLTDDAWFGVTPEPVANKVSDDLTAVTPSSKTVLIDLFAGAGGNAIAFALSGRWSTIIAIEKSISVLACAQRNAAIYGVSDKIIWVNEDCFTYLSSNTSSIDPSQTVVFASPPWGGPGYTSNEIFNLSTMQPYSINQIHSACKKMDSALYLPRTSDLRQIARLVPEGKKVEVVQYCMEGASKALVAYIPASAIPAS